MGDKDSCITATNNYIANYNKNHADFIARYKHVQNINIKIDADNKKAKEKHDSDMAAYETQQRAVRKQDTGNLFNCGTLTDASDVWILDGWTQDNGVSKFACSYRYTDIQIKRLMDNWNLANKFIPKKHIPYPEVVPDPVTIQCCSNSINLTDAVMAEKALENINQSCNISNNDNNGGNGDQNNDPNSDYDTSGTQIDNSFKKKIIISVFAFIVFIVLFFGIIGLVFFIRSRRRR